MEKPNTFVLFLMTQKGPSVLESLVDQKRSDKIECVVIGKDEHVQNDFSEEMSSICKKNDIPFTFDRNKQDFKSVYFLCIGWRWLIKNEEERKIIVFHESLLPKYRGFAPLVNQLINQEEVIGVSALIASEKYDEGPIIKQIKVKINHPIKIQDAIEKVTPIYQELVKLITADIISKTSLSVTDQDHSKATYSLWRDEEDYRINWSGSAEEILRHIYAVGFPYSGASTKLGQEEVRILDAEVVEDVKIENRTAGKIFQLSNGAPIVICGSGMLKITKSVFQKSQKSILPLKQLRQRFE